MTEMHKFLTDFDKYNKKLPFYIEKPFTQQQADLLRSTIEENRNIVVDDLIESDDATISAMNRFYPKKITIMSRELIEFECPKEIEDIMDSYAKPVYKEEIKLCHYNYIKYDMQYGDGKYAPSLPPHIDADENLVTFNYQIGGNVDDWQLVIDGEHYDLKNGDAMVFSAVNQVHWRPKRHWKPGEYVEIVSFDYCPPDNYRFLGDENPIDNQHHPELRQKYIDELNQHPRFQQSWTQYHEEGIELDIEVSDNGGFGLGN
jgi:hypothetical protein